MQRGKINFVMILDFTISNFRSIRRPQTISFEATGDKDLEDYYVVTLGKYRILKMATIYGANASGKSNVIMALRMLPKLLLRPCRDKGSEIAYEKFALNTDSMADDSQMIVNFICGEKKYHYEVVFNNQMVLSELLQCQPFDKLRQHLVYERHTDENTMMASVKWGGNYPMASTGKDINVNLLHNRTVFGAFQMSNVDIPWMKEIVDWLKDYMLPTVSTREQELFNYTSKMFLKNSSDKHLAVSLLKKADVGISDFEIEDQIENIPPTMLDRIMRDETIPLSFKETIKKEPTVHSLQVRMQHTTSRGNVQMDYSKESNGTKRFYELSGVLLKIVKESHFVAIDELECRLHPDLYRHFIIMFLLNAKNSQMVFTTHLRELLGDKDILRRDAIWFTEKNVDGETELYSLADFTEKNLSHLSIFEAYKAGRFGAIPHLGDTHIE